MNHRKPLVAIVAAVASLALTACGASNTSSVNTAETPVPATTTTTMTPTPTATVTTGQTPTPAPTTATTQAIATFDLANASFTDGGPNGSAAALASMVARFPYRFDIPATFNHVDAGLTGAIGDSGNAFWFSLCTSAGYFPNGEGDVSYPVCDQGKDADQIFIAINDGNNLTYDVEPGDLATAPPTTVNVKFGRGPVAKLTLASGAATPGVYTAQFYFQDRQQNQIEIDVSSLSQQTAEAVLSQITVTAK